jgi:hypothetical protein
VLELARERDAWASRMQADGHRVLNEPPGQGDRRYARLLPGSEASRAHQEAGLGCVAWAWDRGRASRYCDQPRTLRAVVGEGRTLDSGERARQLERQRTLDREAARDVTLRAWLATTRGVETRDLCLLARDRIATLSQTDERPLALLGTWLGALGGRSESIAAAEREVADASDTRLLQLWFALEAAHAMASSVVPPWLEAWFARLGPPL